MVVKVNKYVDSFGIVSSLTYGDIYKAKEDKKKPKLDAASIKAAMKSKS
jgi:hypothetical protein